MEQLLSVREAAERLGVGPQRVTTFLKEGRLPGAQRVGKSWAIPVSAVEAFAQVPRPTGRPVSTRKTGKWSLARRENLRASREAARLSRTA